MTFQQSFNERIDTNVIQFPNIAQIRIKNPLKQTLYVNALELLPDSSFAEKGDIFISIGRSIAFSNNSKPLGAYSLFPVPLENQEFLQGDYIEIFARNIIDADMVGISVNIKISETQENQARGAQPLDGKSQRDAISPFDILFPNATRQPSTYTALIFMDGYKKLDVMLSKGSIPDPSLLPTAIEGSNPVICDGDVLTSHNVNTNGVGTGEVQKVDFGSIATRKLTVKIGNTSGDPANARMETKVYVSDNNIDWSLIYNQILNADPIIIINADNTFRFVRVELKQYTAPSITVKFYEIYDANLFGGSGSLSFELLNSVNRWVELIPATEFGTITSDSQDVVQQIGDVTTKSISGKTYGLPSHQTRFRAKYIVTIGGLTNAVDIMRVA